MTPKIENPTCNSGHSDYPLALWDCPVCVQIEKKKLESCDLCDEPAEYRQCQKCMNDKLVGSHTDEEYRELEADNAAQAQTIKAAHIRTAEISTRYNDCQRQVEELREGIAYYFENSRLFSLGSKDYDKEAPAKLKALEAGGDDEA